MNKKLTLTAVGSMLGIVLLAAVPAFAATTTTGATNTGIRGGVGMMGRGMGAARPAVVGTVASINGTSLTVTSKAGPNSTAAATYTVDASAATVTKAGATASVSSIAVGDTVMVQGTVSGTTVTATKIVDGVSMGARGGGAWGQGANPGVFGTVASISGTSLTITSKAGPNSTAAGTTYTVDASAATVTKAGATASVSGIAVGDTVMVQGTVTGTSVVAKTIRDGVMGNKTDGPNSGNTNPVITGNGQPVVAGSVTAVSGTTLTITNKSNVTYTVNAATATVQKAGVASTVANVVVGDNVVVQGTVNGTSVTASSVIDQGSTSNTSTGSASGAHRGFLGAIGGFFLHLFGF